PQARPAARLGGNFGRMSTSAQIAANRANSQLSAGPVTETGKAAAARNNFRHGLAPASAFWVLPSECQSDFNALLAAFHDEHQPATLTEEALVQALAEHDWLRHRALRLEESCFDYTTGQVIDAQKLALYLRYQTTHERAFHKALNDLLKLRAAKRKEQIGFESQQRAERADQRKQERHQWDILLAEAKVDGQQLHDLNRDIKDSERLRVYMKSLNQN
ncbi:MAG: hypothetical protein ACRD5Z_17870, partial [Bryobacteraceae bacterium]